MPSNPPAEDLVGTVLGGRYRLVQLLGTGGTGHVYLADAVLGASTQAPPSSQRGRQPGSRVAIKVLRSEHAHSPEYVSRFERESLAAARIRHPNVLEVHGLEPMEDGRRFFAMELLVGLDLADTMGFAGPLAPTRAVRIATGLAAGLAAAHAEGVVHRDVKPENVFLVHAADGREVVKVLDFGFAWLRGDPADTPSKRITSRMQVVGTPEYMAPEQAQGAPPHPAADIYAAGIVLYEMLAGRVPFLGESFLEVAQLHIGEPPQPMHHLNPQLRVSGELSGAVDRAIAKAPEARYDSIHALRAALLATPEGREAHPSGP